MGREKTYYKDLDLIRVIACIAVFLYHLNVLKGGYLAVCIFFVLSGYLSCVSFFRKEKYSLKEYYKNRLLKIYLPLLVVVFITIATISFIPKINFFNLKPETTSIIFGYNNFWQLNANLDYFAKHTNSPFMHFWYISILLQFDLFFPFIYCILRKIGDKFNRIIPCVVIGIFAIISSIYFYKMALTSNIMLTYYHTFTRIFSLLFGMCLGFIHSYYNVLVPKKFKNKYKIIFNIYNIILILLFILVDSKSIMFPFCMILTSFISCRLIDYGTISNKRDINLFDKFIKFLSSISYEIYLVQYPVIFIFEYININMYFKIFSIIFLTTIIAYLLHICIDFNIKNIKYKIFKYIISGIVLCTTLFGVYKYLITPNYTKEMKKLEEQLAKSQEVINKKQKEYENKRKEENDEWLKKLKDMENAENEIKDIVDNLSVIGVGDSIMLGAVEELYKTFPNGYFDAKISRTAWDANDILQDLKERKMLGDPIVFNLGANGDCPLSYKIEILKTCEDRKIFWLTVTNDSDVNVNDRLVSLASDYPNLHIIDWNSISSGHSEYFYADGIHLTNIGKEAYTKAIYEAIYKVYLEEYNVRREQIIKEHEEEQKNKIIFYGNDILLYALDYVRNDFSDSIFNVNSKFNYESLKLQIEQSVNDKTISKKIVFAFDSSVNLKLEEYQDLIDLCKDSKIYIVFTNEEMARNIAYLNYDNVTVIEFYKELEINTNYLMFDKIHLTDDGNKALSKVLKNIIS